MSLISELKEAVDLLKKGLNIDAQEKIMSLREGLLEVQEENLTLREKVKTLESQLSLSNDYLFVEDVYWKNCHTSRIGPFCPACMDDRKKAIRIHSVDPDTGYKWECKVCRALF